MESRFIEWQPQMPRPTPFVTLSTLNKINLIEVSHAIAFGPSPTPLACPFPVSGHAAAQSARAGCPHGQLWTSIKFIAKQILYKGIIKAAKRLSAEGRRHMVSAVQGALFWSVWSGKGTRPKGLRANWVCLPGCLDAATVTGTAASWLNVNPNHSLWPLTLS